MARVGLGYDSHRFCAGRPLMLGGVRIPHDKGLAGHSDADALLHALVDAMLGALGAGDIGEIFPDTDPRWKDADSSQFVQHALSLVRGAGLRISNCDLTIITQSPKIGPHKADIRARISELLSIGVSAVGLKAKTNEHMGWIGAGEGLAAMAVVCLEDADAGA